MLKKLLLYTGFAILGGFSGITRPFNDPELISRE